MFEKLISQALDSLKRAGATEDQLRTTEAKLQRRQQEKPDPRIALIGFTGVGKSSTINALFVVRSQRTRKKPVSSWTSPATTPS